ncbi:glycosyltransferase family 2 protein [Flavobacterium sp. GP15]|uniref:glycosyltransferase family 2 protein n=1 Tax=Flavobacterium sp. GP15 TaxID=2758567 RepID=UPI00165D659B|nr:glycosyltransferase family 2 protein [Flavobacterium sp. GP15]
MSKSPAVSIIIPVYNRANLLSFTLDSIVKQTFTDWECILVDDRSMDSSFSLIKEYQIKDNRFKVYKRPSQLKKGANACRNFGFTKATGTYIKWFDSDDIMLPKHLEIAHDTLIKNHLDFVVTETINFDHETKELLDSPNALYKANVDFTAENIALYRIGWITDDFLGHRKKVTNIVFNESITDGDEYNFFIKVFQQHLNGIFIKEVVTHRRLHKDSISIKNKLDKTNYMLIFANLKLETAKDLMVYNDLRLIKWFLSGYMQVSFDLALKKKKTYNTDEGFKMICKYFSFNKGIAFFLAFYLAYYFKRGYVIMKYART